MKSVGHKTAVYFANTQQQLKACTYNVSSWENCSGA